MGTEYRLSDDLRRVYRDIKPGQVDSSSHICLKRLSRREAWEGVASDIRRKPDVWGQKVKRRKWFNRKWQWKMQNYGMSVWFPWKRKIRQELGFRQFILKRWSQETDGMRKKDKELRKINKICMLELVLTLELHVKDSLEVVLSRNGDNLVSCPH